MGKHNIIGKEHITESTYVVKLERKGFQFQTGQFIILNKNGTSHRREYSVYSGENDDYLEVLIREVENGKVSKQIKNLNVGDILEVDGPFGFFKFYPEMFPTKKFLFIASGTGISPFHSFIRTFPGLNYQLVHGVRFGDENYGHSDFEKERTQLCVSGESSGDFYGRVTDYLFDKRIDAETQCFLCGNSEMIHEVFDILTGKGIPVSNIYSEVYF